jgi:hypothetical protein
MSALTAVVGVSGAVLSAIIAKLSARGNAFPNHPPLVP